MVPDENVPVVIKSPHDIHMERAANGELHKAVKKPKGIQPGTFDQKHPRDSNGRFRLK